MIRDQFRYVILMLSTLCLSIIFSNMTILNFVLICLDPPVNGTAQTESPAAAAAPHYAYSEFQKAVLQWAASLTSAAATFPLSWACTRYGVRWIFLASGLISAVITALTPAAMAFGFAPFLVSRAVQGVAYACDFAVIGVVCSRWASLRENATFIAALTTFPSVSAFFTNFISGFVCEAWGWPWVYYIHSVLSFMLFAAWILLYTDNPGSNQFVGAIELAIIFRDKTEAHINHEPFVPYLSICRDPVVLVVWLCAFVNLLAGFFIVIYAPTYIKNVLNYGVAETGVIGAIILAMNTPFKIACGVISDNFNCMSERHKMWIFNTIAVLLPAMAFLAMFFAPAAHPLSAVLILGTIEALIGANCGSFYKCGSLASRQYAEFVIGFTQFFKCAVFFVAPALVTIFVHDVTSASQWHIIFIILAVSLAVTHVVFCIYATDKPRTFTKITARTRAKA